ncbi:MAG: flagellar motor switch protein FliN [Nitrospirales bacterium]
MSDEEAVDLDSFDAEKEMMEALAQESGGKVQEAGGKSVPAKLSDPSLERILDIPLLLSAQLGNTRMLIKDLLQLGPGSIVELDKLAGEPLEILVNDKLVARGEVVMVNEKFGVRLTDVVSPTERVNKLGG